MTKHKPDIRFTVNAERTWQGSNLIRCTLHAVIMRPDGELNSPGYFYSGDPDYQANELQDLVIDAQASDGDDHWYGWEAGYKQRHFTGLREARIMVSVLTRIDRALTREQDMNGSPASFPVYATRVARAVGAWSPNLFAVPDSYHPGGQRFTGTDGLAHYLTTIN